MPIATDSLPATPTRRMEWVFLLPALAAILLVLAVGGLLWVVQETEREEERNALIKDVLWLEQNLRFHLGSHAEKLQQLAADLGNGSPSGTTTFRNLAGSLVRNNPDLRFVVRLDTRGRPIDGVPAIPPTPGSLDRQTANHDIAHRLGKASYSDVLRDEQGNTFFELAIPVYLDQHQAGLIVGVYDFQAMLDSQVPWWFTEKHNVQILDGNDQRIAAKSNISTSTLHTYEVALDPPGQGLRIHVSSHKPSTNLLQRSLVAAIALLTLIVFWSLRAVRNLIRERSRAEQALRGEHAFRTSMEDSLTVGMRARDREGQIIYVNPAFCEMTGFSKDELVGRRPPMPYWVPDQIEETFAMHRIVMAGGAPPDGFEITFRRKNGELFEALIYEAPLIDGQGAQIGWMASVLDITERKRAQEIARQHQEKLQFTSRLITMGEMASTLAHELNQPLAAIASYNTGCLNLLAQDALSNEDLRQALEKIGVQAQRAGRIIRRVHDFVRKSEPRLSPCDLNELIEDCLGFIESDARKRQVRIEPFVAKVPPVMADRTMLEQVLLNLMRNGMDAMADTPEDQRILRLSVDAAQGEIVIRVADQGHGIPDDIRDKLFTAFFTTKVDGMGVGLSICRSIVELHRGRLWVDPNLDAATGSGTIFTVTLPVLES